MVAIDDEMDDNDDQWNSQSKEGCVTSRRDVKSGLPARQGLFTLMLPCSQISVINVVSAMFK